MAGLLVCLAAFFIVATVIQAGRMQKRIEDAARPTASLADAVQLGGERGLGLAQARLDAQLRLEQYAMESRYQQAGLILMARVWIIYLGFVTGMILALVGAAFILGRLEEPASQLAGESSVLKVSIATTSPGLILAVLGTVLMATTMAIRAEVTVTDKPLYVLPQFQLADGAVSTRPAEPPDVSDEDAANPRDDSGLDALERAEENLRHSEASGTR